MDPTAKQSIIDRLKQANNVLVTVKSDPSVDQLAACIGFTLFLNKLGKHATAVFSGDIPSTLEFLKPEETLEKNTDSLRDFIIALDKSKADKLRYKVEDTVVKIFITPYKTSLSEQDLEFSQGDFNVDVIIALGVHAKEDLDQAIVAHGRILHDATVISLNNGPGGQLGTLHLEDPKASSLSEMLVAISEGLKPDSFDAQMATALLTGIVAETERFSNTKTSPQTMSLAAKLMAAGANQQLIATQLQASMVAGGATATTQAKPAKDEQGTLTIEHTGEEAEEAKAKEAESNELATLPEPVAGPIADTLEPPLPGASNGAITDVKTQAGDTAVPSEPPQPPTAPATRNFPLEPPTMGGTLTANTQPPGYEPPSTDIFGQTSTGQTLQHTAPTLEATPKSDDLDDKTLSDIEKTVDSQHLEETPAASANAASPLDQAREAVEEATGPATIDTIEQRTGASFFDPDVQGPHAAPATPAPTPAPAPAQDLPTQPANTTQNASSPPFLTDKSMPDEPAAPAPPPVPAPVTPPVPPMPASPPPVVEPSAPAVASAPPVPPPFMPPTPATPAPTPQSPLTPPV